jgi:hypothetical protein
VTHRDLDLQLVQGIGSGRSEPTVSVVIPAKNEALNLPLVSADLMVRGGASEVGLR